MTTTNPETGETIDGRSPRFSYWCAFLVFSTISLGAAVEEKNSDTGFAGAALKNQRWAVACASMTFVLSLIVVLMHLHHIGSNLIVGTKIEGTLIIILTAFWAATVSIVSDARHGLAVNTSGDVSNGNLYYFTWAGFVCAILMCVSYLRAAYGVDVVGEVRSRSARLTTWSAVLACQLIVMGSCSNIFDQDCSPRFFGTPPEFCTRTKFGISIGALGVASSVGVVGMKIATSNAPFMAEAGLSFMLVVLNGFGVAYLTSAKGPGSGLGNLYYFSWGSLLACVMLCVSIVEQYQSAKAAPPEVQEGEIQVESLDSSDV